MAASELHPPDLPGPRRWRVSGEPRAFELRAFRDVDAGSALGAGRPAVDAAAPHLWRVAQGENRAFLRKVVRELDEWRAHALTDAEVGDLVARWLATGRLRLVALPTTRPRLPIMPGKTEAEEPEPERKKAPEPEATVEVGTETDELELNFATNLEEEPALEFGNELESVELEFGRELGTPTRE